jgi:hypothetical protein
VQTYLDRQLRTESYGIVDILDAFPEFAAQARPVLLSMLERLLPESEPWKVSLCRRIITLLCPRRSALSTSSSARPVVLYRFDPVASFLGLSREIVNHDPEFWSIICRHKDQIIYLRSRVIEWQCWDEYPEIFEPEKMPLTATWF